MPLRMLAAILSSLQAARGQRRNDGARQPRVTDGSPTPSRPTEGGQPEVGKHRFRVGDRELPELVGGDFGDPREVRVGVTMVGGIALAIYENGAARELFRMVQGEGPYGLIKRLTHSHVIIDVLSGTSAGGINAIFLSAALTLQNDFASTQEVWIALGGIDQLLQDPRKSDVAAILQGNDYYLPAMRDAFRALVTDPRTPPTGIRSGFEETLDPAGNRGTGYTDLDLFVTGTYYRGRRRTFFDVRNQPIFTEDYHGVFHLKHRPHRGESHFDPALQDPAATALVAKLSEDSGKPWPADGPPSEARTRGVIERLARVARTTSSLPAAFEPSLVEATLMNGVIELPAGRSFNFILDGGFLNNRPLDLAVKAVSERRADLDVRRKLFFVEPTPDEFQPQGPLAAPTALENIWFFKDVPGRQSPAGYLDAVYEHNRRARRLKETLRSARAMAIASAGGSNGTGSGPAAAKLWMTLRVQDLRDDIVAGWQRHLGLEGFGGSLSVGDASADYQQRLAAAENLRAARSCLLAVLEEHIERWLVLALDHTRRNKGGFRLAEVDCLYLDRKIRRVIEETRWAVYPDPAYMSAEAPTPPVEAQQRARAATQPCLDELHFL